MKRSDLAGLTLFAEVVTRGGFRGAGKAIGISPSAVSHGIATLEKRLGVRLLNRTTRSIAPTEDDGLAPFAVSMMSLVIRRPSGL